MWVAPCRLGDAEPDKSLAALSPSLRGRFDEPPPWEVIFEPSIDASNLYAVELPAFELMAEAAEAAGLGEVEEGDVEVGKEMQEGSRGVLPFLWQEEFARLFLGDPGSMTCLHVDLIPQVEFCHMLVGAKVS